MRFKQLSLFCAVLLYFTCLLDITIGNCPEDETPSPSPSSTPSPVSITPSPTPSIDDTEIEYLSSNTTVNAPPECVMPPDCKAWRQLGVNKSGVYPVNPDDGGSPFQVYCDMETNGGGWIVFQRRQSNTVNFYRDWADYEKGFGDLMGNFWLGLDKIASLTNQGSTSLRIEMGRFNGEHYYVHYSHFAVTGASYRLSVSGFSGNTSDSMAYHNGQGFSTKNHGGYKGCAIRYKGAWWYKGSGCYDSHLNGVYYNDNNHRGYTGLSWGGINSWESLKSARMMLRSNV